MRHGILLISAAAIVAGCAANPAESGSGHQTDPYGTVGSSDARQTPSASWTAYRTIYFASTTIDVSASDMAKINEIVAYLQSNPSLDIRIDGTLDITGFSDADRVLGNRRAASVRKALMDAGAGVASYKIFIGAFVDPNLRRAGQIQILVGPRTSSLTTVP